MMQVVPVSNSDSVLLDEVVEQPRRLEDLLHRGTQDALNFADIMRNRSFTHVVLAARGSSNNASRYARYVFGSLNRLSVVLATPSLFTEYRTPPRMTGALVIGISQSGRSPELVEVLREGHKQGCATLAITNIPDSPLALAADHVLLLHAGLERSVAATKTYTAELLSIAMLSSALEGDKSRWAQLRKVPDMVQAALQVDRFSLLAACQSLTNAYTGVVIARGFNSATASEVSLKLKELAHLAMEPYSAAAFQHGPLSMVDDRLAVLFINVAGAVSEQMEDVLRIIIRLGASPIVLSNVETSLALASIPIRLPASIPEWLSPIVAVIPGQLLSIEASRARGLDPDHPRNLVKVTRTA